MQFEQITKRGADIVRRCETRDPFKIANELGIFVNFSDEFTKLKGMYRVIKRNRYIILNSKLSEKMQNIVCAHEIGHDQLHRNLAKDDFLQEFMLYQMDTRPEYEANIFATEILLDTKDVLELIETGYDVEQIALALDSDINLVALKIAHLKNQGYKLKQIDHHSDFLK